MFVDITFHLKREIELPDGWENDYDRICEMILDEVIETVDNAELLECGEVEIW